MKTPIKVDALKVGDKITFVDSDGDVSNGIFTHVSDDGKKYYFTWDEDQSLYLGKFTLEDFERCWMHDIDDDSPITKETIVKVLETYYEEACPQFFSEASDNNVAIVDYIYDSLILKSDPEYAEYLRLKEKFINV